jgi:hypothetical protein
VPASPCLCYVAAVVVPWLELSCVLTCMLSISRYTALLPLLEDDNCNLFPPNIRQILIEVHATPTDMELAPTPFDGMV